MSGWPYRRRLLSFALVAAMGLSGCGTTSLLGDKEVDIGPTLADLQPVELPDPTLDVPPISMDDIERLYQRALEVADNPDVRRKILIRLAGLQMVRSENQQLAST